MTIAPTPDKQTADGGPQSDTELESALPRLAAGVVCASLDPADRRGIPLLNGDWLTTVRQSLPRLGQLVRHMRPTWRLSDVSTITAEWLSDHGIEAAIWDVDGTLMAYHQEEIDPRFGERLRGLFRSPQIKHAILSNCGEDRFELLARIFPETPILRCYRRPDGGVVRRVLRGERDSLSPDALETLLRSGARAIRKPDGELLRQAMAVLEIDKPHLVVMIGDQYLTDVASASLAGARSIKVDTFRRDTFPLPVRLSQAIERTLYRLLYGQPR